jgi:hypothetical protein
VLSLTSLAGWEEAVLASVAGATGSVDERDSQIERSGLERPAFGASRRRGETRETATA